MPEEVAKSFGMPVKEFSELAFARLEAGEENIVIGSVAMIPKSEFDAHVDTRFKMFNFVATALAKD
jgi:hypothetical protein